MLTAGFDNYQTNDEKRQKWFEFLSITLLK